MRKGEFLIEWQAFIQETFIRALDEQENLEMIYILCSGKAIAMPFILNTLIFFLFLLHRGTIRKTFQLC